MGRVENLESNNQTTNKVSKQETGRSHFRAIKNLTKKKSKIDQVSQKAMVQVEERSVSSFTEFKVQTLAELREHILNQRNEKSYEREKLQRLRSADRNGSFEIPSNLPEGVQKACWRGLLYTFDSEGINDYGWGCAWRAIQTTLSAFKVETKFEELFHLFGRREVLNNLYYDKYAEEIHAQDKKFAPYELRSGWAEPFIGEMALRFYGITSRLETINGIPGACNAPEVVFHNDSLSFTQFVNRLDHHFSGKKPAPIMIDDASYAFNIIGMGQDEESVTFWISDPHIQPNKNSEDHRIGLYTVTLDREGRQLDCSLDGEDEDQLPHLFCDTVGARFEFHQKKWMVLMPGSKIKTYK